MYRFDTTTDERQAVSATHDLSVRLNWLTTALEESARHARLFRTAREAEEAASMRKPISTQEAYALFGMLLGLLPAGAIIFRLLNLIWWDFQLGNFVYLSAGLAMCMAVGYRRGAKAGLEMDEIERGSWPHTVVGSLEAGFIWAVITGAAGGAVFFLVGSLFGLICALPVGLAGFLLFTIFHRLLARGGMIDARRFWPLAWGVALTITALILSPHVIPY